MHQFQLGVPYAITGFRDFGGLSTVYFQYVSLITMALLIL